MLSRRSSLLLWAGDLLCLAAFVLLGMQTHDTLTAQSAPVRFAVFFLPLAVAWTLAAAGVGALPILPPLNWPRLWGRTLAAWLIAAPLALLARALLLQAPTIFVVFALVTLGLGGAVLLAWRSLALWLAYGRV